MDYTNRDLLNVFSNEDLAEFITRQLNMFFERRLESNGSMVWKTEEEEREFFQAWLNSKFCFSLNSYYDHWAIWKRGGGSREDWPEYIRERLCEF